jgi:hypothetical protein
MKFFPSSGLFHSMSALGQTLPIRSALVRINVCYSPIATVSRISRE